MRRIGFKLSFSAGLLTLLFCTGCGINGVINAVNYASPVLFGFYILQSLL